MKICVAQIRPVKGDIQANIEGHKKLIALAVAHRADMIIFPELSITGYEPELAKELATHKDDKQLDIFQHISNNQEITIGAGMPLRNNDGILISMIIFQPFTERRVYSKQYLHEDEFPYFVNAKRQAALIDSDNKIAVAICCEISVPEHAENAAKNGALIYIASVAKSKSGIEKAINSLPGTAKKYSMRVLLSNCVGHCDNFDCGGRSSAWDKEGKLLGQLDDNSEGVLIIDTDTNEIIEETLNSD